MKHVMSFNELNENIMDREEYILKIKGQYDELKRKHMSGEILIGKVDYVSNTDISNLEQTFKDGKLTIKDGNYYLVL